MNCYVCDNDGRATEAVAICRHCGVTLCRNHLDEGLLAQKPGGLVRRACLHNPVGAALSRRDSRDTLADLEALW